MSFRSVRLMLLLGYGIPSMSHAQSEPAQSEASRAEILVIATGQSKATSASKAETPLIESPQTISVISREEMDVRAVATVADAVAYTAGVQAESFGIDSRTDEITVRGFGAGAFRPTTISSMACACRRRASLPAPSSIPSRCSRWKY